MGDNYRSAIRCESCKHQTVASEVTVMSQGYRKSMTWGTLPTQDEFDAAFEAANCRNGVYHITLSSSDARDCDGLQRCG
jgi:hypothetical protein